MAFTSEQIKVMDSIITRYPRKRSAIMPLLHYVQSIDGYVTNEGIELIGKKLELATAEVTAVSTFYTQYKSKPVGQYHVGICTNTLCAAITSAICPPSHIAAVACKLLNDGSRK